MTLEPSAVVPLACIIFGVERGRKREGGREGEEDMRGRREGVSEGGRKGWWGTWRNESKEGGYIGRVGREGG